MHAFYILPLKGYDVILKANWLKRFSPNFIDWEKRIVSITHKGEWLTLVDKQVTGQDCLISAKACSQQLIECATAYVLQLNPHQWTSNKVQTESPESPISEILKCFDGVFTEPEGLPPSRNCDHSIPLQEGSTPPNIRPYRIPHKQKDVIE
jgi:hypothetical protein